MSPRRRLAVVAALAATGALIVTGCGGGDSADALPPAATAPAGAAAPIAVAPVSPGGEVRAGSETPKPVVKALEGNDVVVVAFLVSDIADDESVADAVREARSSASLSTGVQWFVYTVGKDRFGDLADLLGVTGTPSVAVIGRDRVLANLWTGLIDAEILRQSVSDAKDTAAANLADAAKPTDGPTGSAKGIALAKQVNAAYRSVPGVAASGTATEDGVTTDFDVRFVIKSGLDRGYAGTFVRAGKSLEVIDDGEASTYVRAEGRTCWIQRPGDDQAPEPAVELEDHRFSAPARRDGALVLRSVGPDSDGKVESATYLIDPTTKQLRSVTTDNDEATYTALDKAPEIVTPTPICGDSATQ